VRWRIVKIMVRERGSRKLVYMNVLETSHTRAQSAKKQAPKQTNEHTHTEHTHTHKHTHTNTHTPSRSTAACSSTPTPDFTILREESWEGSLLW